MNPLRFAPYSLLCPGCGAKLADDGRITTCPNCSRNGPAPLLRVTPETAPVIDTTQVGVRRYCEFLPVKQLDITESKLTATWKSEGFARSYGLSNLYFTATGYSHAKDIFSVCSSFKELEALVVINRLKSYGINQPLVIASAGNTARAFAYYGARLEYPVIIVIPSASQRFLWLPDAPGLHEKALRYVRTVIVDAPGKYLHASLLSANIAKALAGRVIPEGGYFNPGRISGLGMCALNFFDLTQRFPEHYVQAVGSASGVLAAIRAFELLEKNSTMSIAFHLVQNTPYTPLVQAIENRDETISSDMYPNIDTVCSPMLTSADPAWSYPGGLLQEMKRGLAMHGHSVTNQEIYDVQYQLWRTERLSVLLPAAAAVGGLLKAVKAGIIGRDQCIMVNITGMGAIDCMADHGFFYVPSSLDNQVQEVVCYGGAAFTRWIDKNCETLL